MRREHGFTLVDLLIAMTIGGMLIGVFATVVLVAGNALRAADENFRGGDDVQILLVHLTRDVQAAQPPMSADVAADQLALRVPSVRNGAVLRITYTYATDTDAALTRPTAKITRVVSDGATVAETTDVARNLRPNHSPVFVSCGTGCVTVNIPFVVGDNVVVRTATFASRLATQ